MQRGHARGVRSTAALQADLVDEADGGDLARGDRAHDGAIDRHLLGGGRALLRIAGEVVEGDGDRTRPRGQQRQEKEDDHRREDTPSFASCAAYEAPKRAELLKQVLCVEGAIDEDVPTSWSALPWVRPRAAPEPAVPLPCGRVPAPGPSTPRDSCLSRARVCGDRRGIADRCGCIAEGSGARSVLLPSHGRPSMRLTARRHDLSRLVRLFRVSAGQPCDVCTGIHAIRRVEGIMGQLRLRPNGRAPG